jgi:hypothetical protein
MHCYLINFTHMQNTFLRTRSTYGPVCGTDFVYRRRLVISIGIAIKFLSNSNSSRLGTKNSESYKFNDKVR